MFTVTYKPIGIIYTPFKEAKGTPIQPEGARDVKGRLELFSKYVDGVKDLEGFSHIILIYHFHLVNKYKLLVKPFMDNVLHGVFATRAPSRPNPIGISVVSLLSIEENILHVRGIDVVDGTPLLDIKPFVPQFDIWERVERIGWLDTNVHKLPESRDDERFIE